MVKATRKYEYLDAERFIRAWQSSSSPKEAAKKYGRGMTYDRAVWSACSLRKRGIQLKRFKPRGNETMTRREELNRLAKEAAK